MGEYKTIFNVYAAWDYEKEVDDLNMHSNNGLQLIKGGLVHCKFKQDNNIVYRYQIDYNPNINNKLAYIDAFKEQGWEYINSTFNGWHYFRKKYDDSLPENEYEIYTDQPSKVEMTKRWGKIATILLIVMGIFFIINFVKLICTPELSRIGLVGYIFTLVILLTTGLIKMKKVGNGNKFKQKFHLGTMLIVLVLGYTWFTVFSSLKATTNVNLSTTTYGTKMDMPNTINVKCPDLYYLSIHSKSEVGVTFTLESEDFETIYTISGDDLDVKNHRILLRKGVYTIHTVFENDNLSNDEKSVKFNYSLK